MLELMNVENISSNIFLSFLSNKSVNGFHFLILPVSASASAFVLPIFGIIAVMCTVYQWTKAKKVVVI
jgi:hypothetical protein